ncbi:hotdog fold domain-containing protein [Stenotrophomonas geniculata]|uniref:hotdog fold domain-containing protein n=1 Tax=Stenotrophomonas geniculata TaxID=86188 RepID=UPI00247A26E0|nr:hotdog fold domain-containing protein [Stenotrophomonas geniculata]MDH7551940.1 hotdog fold domain-containing protein [Stenotrophomonas geniculata]
MSTPLLSLYHRLQRWPAGTWLFSRAVCFKAPYFASIAPRITRLEHGRCEGTLADRRKVRNHIGTVHAIAMCNLAELTAGLMVDASLPADMRWIPKGMDVKYQAKALGTLKAVATPVLSIVSAADGYDLPVKVSVTDAAGTEVFHATIAMWVSPRPPRTG